MKKIVLVVDDEPLNIRILAEILSPQYRVLVAKSGSQALDRVKAQPDISAILLDVMMPEMSGFEVCETLKQNPDTAHISVIFVSAMSQEEDRTKGMSVGGHGFVLKPIQPPQLFSMLEDVL